MKNVLKIGSYLGLILTIIPPLLFFYGKLELKTMNLLLGIGMILWMITAPFWINEAKEAD